jgi:acyl carrier protein
MRLQLENEFVDLIVNWVRKNMQTNGNGHGEITLDTNLMEGGLLDSIGFVGLIVFIEEEMGCNLDLTDVDPSEFSTVKGLSRIAFGNHKYAKTHAGNLVALELKPAIDKA